jgi:hypothetical protein
MIAIKAKAMIWINQEKVFLGSIIKFIVAAI